MKRDTWEPLMLALKKKGYVVYFVDTDAEPKVLEAWQKMGRLNSIPAYAVTTRGGKYLVAYGQGYRNKTDFVRWLNSSIDEWKKKQQKTIPR
jgi:hypothetical protein